MCKSLGTQWSCLIETVLISTHGYEMDNCSMNVTMSLNSLGQYQWVSMGMKQTVVMRIVRMSVNSSFLWVYLWMLGSAASFGLFW